MKFTRRSFLTLAAGGVVGAGGWMLGRKRQTPITEANAQQFCGWAGEKEARRAWGELGGSFPQFQIIKTGLARATGRVALWTYAKLVNKGRHLPTFRQEIGDCVSMGAANAVNYLACMQIVRLGAFQEYHPAFQPYIYGVSRVQIGGGRLGRSDGSLGIWAADGVRRYGVLAADHPQCPQYDGSVAKEWGYKGPPQWAINTSSSQLVKTTAPVSTVREGADALTNGYPITVASMQGFRMEGRRRNGKLWGVPTGEWAHQMCFIAYDPDDDSFYCLNSWGETAHGEPEDDAPPGGFWVEGEIVEKMLRQGDSFAYSQFDGFPEQDLDFRIFSRN